MAEMQDPDVEGIVTAELEADQGHLSDTTEERRLAAARNKAAFESFVRGGKARAEMLPRGGIQNLAFGVTGLMLNQLMTGRLKPASAKEAADIARITHDIARKESGEDGTTVVRSPEERERAVAAILELANAAKARAIEAGAIVEDVIDVVDPDIEEGVANTPPVRSTPSGRVLARVRAT